jgi:hypothetical protein
VSTKNKRTPVGHSPISSRGELRELRTLTRRTRRRHLLATRMRQAQRSRSGVLSPSSARTDSPTIPSAKSPNCCLGTSPSPSQGTHLNECPPILGGHLSESPHTHRNGPDHALTRCQRWQTQFYAPSLNPDEPKPTQVDSIQMVIGNDVVTDGSFGWPIEGTRVPRTQLSLAFTQIERRPARQPAYSGAVSPASRDTVILGSKA